MESVKTNTENGLNPLDWLCDWYAGECNGDWEEDYGITIETLDNPGWAIKIDLKDTSVAMKKFADILEKQTESDWFGFELRDGAFFGYGDPSKLPFLLKAFRNYAQTGKPI